jgi:hypothetical protein
MFWDRLLFHRVRRALIENHRWPGPVIGIASGDNFVIRTFDFAASSASLRTFCFIADLAVMNAVS